MDHRQPPTMDHGDSRWRRNLYDNHGLADNYTDKCFLEQLRKNVKANNVTLMDAVNLCAGISTRLTIVVLFDTLFVLLYNQWITPTSVFASGAALTIVNYFLYHFLTHATPDKLAKHSRTALLFLAFGYILSSVLKTLTESISTDTIYAMTISMFLIHLVFSKYDFSEIWYSYSLSTTSSIFGSIMLASRLATPLHAFSLLTVSVECFVLLPFLLYRISDRPNVSVALAIVATCLLAPLSLTLACIFVATTAFIHFVCPVWYVRSQKYKDNIYGPWDEAVISS